MCASLRSFSLTPNSRRRARWPNSGFSGYAEITKNVQFSCYISFSKNSSFKALWDNHEGGYTKAPGTKKMITLCVLLCALFHAPQIPARGHDDLIPVFPEMPKSPKRVQFSYYISFWKTAHLKPSGTIMRGGTQRHPGQQNLHLCVSLYMCVEAQISARRHDDVRPTFPAVSKSQKNAYIS